MTVRSRSLLFIFLALLVAALAAGAWYASPWWAVHQLRQAAQARDIDALMARVDQRALERSVRLALGFRVAEAMHDTRGEGARARPEGAREMQAAQVDSLTRTLTAPPLLLSMLIQGYPSSAITGNAAMETARISAVEASEGRLGDWEARIQYVDWDTVRVRSARTPTAGAFILRRSGLCGWQLSGLEAGA